MLEAEAVTDPGVTGATLVESGPELGYTVSVDAFSGPLDLLLFLVRKSELDIIEIPIATITDQFVALIKQWQQQGELDLEAAGDFPKRVKLGACRVAWVAEEVEAWIEVRIGNR